MKFYYNGQLMRTSKTHNYTHAVIAHHDDGTISCIACSASRELAEKALHNLWQCKNYRMWASVQDGTYKPKDRWASGIEKLRKDATNIYGSVEAAIEHWKSIIVRYEIVEVTEA